jgi:GTP pyrophosphokinase
VEQGKEEFDKFAKIMNYDTNRLDDKTVTDFFSKNNIKTAEDLFYEIGTGTLSAHGSINRILGINEQKLDEDAVLKQYSDEAKPVAEQEHASNAFGIIVEGLDKAQLRLANCCQPIMGDDIVGYISKGTGIVVHRTVCPNITKSEQERFINIHWDHDFTNKIFQTTLRVSAFDKRGLLPEMINTLNSTKVTITSVTSTQIKIGECLTKFKFNVASLDDLNHAIVSLSKISEIYDITRVIK